MTPPIGPKGQRAIRAVSNIVTAKNPGKTAGVMAAGAIIAAHPIAGAAIARPVAKLTEKVVNKGIEVVKNPENQAKAKAVGAKIVGATKTGVHRALNTRQNWAGKANSSNFNSQAIPLNLGSNVNRPPTAGPVPPRPSRG